ncbi:MAG: GxxExxY protein [Gemmatimonadales bacterium]|nr:GxxExxY protein [Gemmatimonadales bacterium]
MVVSHAVIGAAIEVHRQLGPGLLESIYERALCRELWLRGVPSERQVLLPVAYKGVDLDVAVRLDLIVEGKVIVEVKAVEALAPIHRAQLLTYLKLSALPLGLLLNFNVTLLRHGVRRIFHG